MLVWGCVQYYCVRPRMLFLMLTVAPSGGTQAGTVGGVLLGLVTALRLLSHIHNAAWML